MKINLLILIFIISVFPARGQFNCRDSSTYDSYKNKTHNVAGFIPCNARVTNGLGIGWSASIDDYCAHVKSIRINGAYINVSPFQIILAGMGIVMMPFALFSPNTYRTQYADTIDYVEDPEGHQLNGFGFSLFETGEDFTFNGLHIPVLGNNSDKLNGMSTTVFYNKYLKFNGVMFSVFYNKTLEGRGVQIGLFNKAKHMNGFQFGLWNKIGKRGLPFVNMSFKKKNRELK